MTICFLSAMETEVAVFLNRCTVVSKERFGIAQLYTLDYNGAKFYACVSGVGKVLAGSGTMAAIMSHPDIDAFINVGIGGSLDATKAPLMTAVLGSKFVQHDYDTSAFGDPYGYLWGPNRVFIEADLKLNELLQGSCRDLGVAFTVAPIASGDKFMVLDADKKVVQERFGALMIDMETAAFAELAYVNEKPFACLRIVSDAVDHDKEYLQYREVAAAKACEIALHLLDALPRG